MYQPDIQMINIDEVIKIKPKYKLIPFHFICSYYCCYYCYFNSKQHLNKWIQNTDNDDNDEDKDNDLIINKYIQIIES